MEGRAEKLILRFMQNITNITINANDTNSNSTADPAAGGEEEDSEQMIILFFGFIILTFCK